MTADMERCAAHALDERGEFWDLTVADLLAEDNGHHYHRGWHIGWKWGGDDANLWLDILDEHRMTDIEARRVFPDGVVESLDTPRSMRVVGDTPEEDARLEREYFEHNRRAYATLSDLGLLPDVGANLTNQDIDACPRSGDDDPG